MILADCDFIDDSLDHALEQGSLGGEIIQKTAFANPRALGNSVEGEAAGADLPDDLGGGIEYFCARIDALSGGDS